VKNPEAIVNEKFKGRFGFLLDNIKNLTNETPQKYIIA
jgi:hypothetical protein